jgi:hypothetical protein
MAVIKAENNSFKSLEIYFLEELKEVSVLIFTLIKNETMWLLFLLLHHPSTQNLDVYGNITQILRTCNCNLIDFYLKKLFKFI